MFVALEVFFPSWTTCHLFDLEEKKSHHNPFVLMLLSIKQASLTEVSVIAGLSWDQKKVSFKDKKSQSSCLATYRTRRECGRPFPAFSAMPSIKQSLTQGWVYLYLFSMSLGISNGSPEIKTVSIQKQSSFFSILQANSYWTTQGKPIHMNVKSFLNNRTIELIYLCN